MACAPDYKGIKKMTELRDRCDGPPLPAGITVKDMTSLTLEQIRTLYKYADIIHDHCDGNRSTIPNCAKNRYHALPDELVAFLEPAGADVSGMGLIQFLGGIHNGDKLLNTNDIEGSFDTLLATAFPTEFGINQNTEAIKLQRANQTANTLRADTPLTVPLASILSGAVKLDALTDDTIIQLQGKDVILTAEQEGAIGMFVHGFFDTFIGGGSTPFQVMFDSSPSVKAFMKQAGPSKFTQLYTAQTVLDSASSGRTLLGGPANMFIQPHQYKSYALTNASRSLGRANTVAEITTEPSADGKSIRVVCVLNNIGADTTIEETIYIEDVVGQQRISSGPSLGYIATLNDECSTLFATTEFKEIYSRKDVDAITASLQSINNKLCELQKCDATMWKMTLLLGAFIHAYARRAIPVETMAVDFLDFINDWKGFGDAEMVYATTNVPGKNLFATVDRVSATFGRFAGLPVVRSNGVTKEHILYRPVIAQTVGGQYLSELKHILTRLQSYTVIMKNYVLLGSYMPNIEALYNATRRGTPERPNPAYILDGISDNYLIKYALTAKIHDLHVYIDKIRTKLLDFQTHAHAHTLPVLQFFSPTTQNVFDIVLTPNLQAIRSYDASRIHSSYLVPISLELLTKFETSIPDDNVRAIIGAIKDPASQFPRFTVPIGADVKPRVKTQLNTLDIRLITLPLYINILKLFMEHIEKALPELVELETMIQKITRMTLLERQNSPTVFVKKLHTINTQLRAGNALLLNSELRLSPTTFVQLVHAYDTLFLPPNFIRRDEFSPRHPFIAALKQISKAFFNDELRSAYETDIDNRIIPSLNASINSLIGVGERPTAITNRRISDNFDTLLNTALYDSAPPLAGTKRERNTTRRNNNKNNNNATQTIKRSKTIGGNRLANTKSVKSDIVYTLGPPIVTPGSDRNKASVLDLMYTFAYEYHTLYVLESELNVRVPDANFIHIYANEVEYTSSEHVVVEKPASLTFSGVHILKPYIDDVLIRVGFSLDSYVDIKEFIDECEISYKLMSGISQEITLSPVERVVTPPLEPRSGLIALENTTDYTNTDNINKLLEQKSSDSVRRKLKTPKPKSLGPTPKSIQALLTAR